MKKEVADKWVEALRSGKYKQTSRHLRRPDGFCCLGVLCDISGLGEWSERVERYAYGYATEGHYEDVGLPYHVMIWAGMRTGSGVRGNGGSALSTLNDCGSSFEIIADIIEEDWKTL